MCRRGRFLAPDMIFFEDISCPIRLGNSKSCTDYSTASELNLGFRCRKVLLLPFPFLVENVNDANVGSKGAKAIYCGSKENVDTYLPVHALRGL